MTIRAARRKAAAILNGVLISTVGAKLAPAKPKTVSCKRVESRDGETIVLVSKEGRQALVRVRNGTPDWMTFDQIFVDEDYDLRPLARFNELRGRYDSMISKGETPLIIDLGANVGFSAVYFHLTWPGAKVIAVEPDLGNLEQLKKNVSGIDEIDVVSGAIASRSGELQIQDGSADGNAVRIVKLGEGRGDVVRAITVPDILQGFDGQRGRPFIVKVDIEGAEADLFSCNTDWMDSVPLLMVELHDWLYPREGTSRAFLTAVSSRDRDFVYLDENVFSIRNAGE